MRWPWPQIALGLLLATVAIALLAAASTSTAAFGAYNPAWDGASDLRSVAASAAASHETLLDVAAYPTANASGTVAVVLAPESAYGADANTLRRFVENGGTLVVADDVGETGNALLASVGATARFNGSLLRDEDQYYRSPAMPIASNVTTHADTAGVDRLTLNHGTAVDPTGATVLVRTSELAYLDTTPNDRLDDTERLDRYPVATVERVGQGRVVAVGDPSIFINVMLDQPDNRRFARNLLDADHVLLDYSHAGHQPPLAVALIHLRRSPTLQTVVGLGVILVALLVGRRLPRVPTGFMSRPANPTDDE